MSNGLDLPNNDADISVPSDFIIDPATGQITSLLQALATPILRGEAGGSLKDTLTPAGSYICGIDTTPKEPATLQNLVLSFVSYIPAVDDPPPGFKTQFALEVVPYTNAISTIGVIFTWGMWQLESVGGGAGGYTQSMAPGFVDPSFQIEAFSPLPFFGGGLGDWVDVDSPNAIASVGDFAFGVKFNGNLATNAMLGWRSRLYRRWVLASS